MVKRINAEPADVQDVTEKPASGQSDTLAGLDALEREAASSEQQGRAEAQQQAAKQERQQADTLQDDLADALSMAATVAAPAMWWLTPEQFDQLWGAKVQKAIAASGAEIMRRHGLSLGDLMSQYGPYIGLAGALGPSTLATVAAFKRKKLELRQQGGGDGASSQAG